MVFDAEYHRARIRELAQEPPDEPTHCELKQNLSYTSKAEKAELVKDIVSFSNTSLEYHGSYGYLIFGVSPDGNVLGLPDSLGGDPPSDIRNLLNRHLDRTVEFEFLSTHVGDCNQDKKVAAVIIPNSRRRPHVISRELQEQEGRKTKFLLREGDLWIRKAGGRQLATAEDMDNIYEAKLLSAARDASEPLKQRIEVLESELAELKSASPNLYLGVAMRGEREPLQEAPALTAKRALLTSSELAKLEAEFQWVRSKAELEQQQENFSVFGRLGTDPTSRDYMKYGQDLRYWLDNLDNFLIVDIALSNTGEVPAEDVYVEIEIPLELTAREELPTEKPERPASTLIRNMGSFPSRAIISKRNAPEDLIGPDINDERRLVTWEVARLYHGRPVNTDSDEEDVGGLLLGREPFERLMSDIGSVDLSYTIRAANLRQPVMGKIRLLPALTH